MLGYLESMRLDGTAYGRLKTNVSRDVINSIMPEALEEAFQNYSESLITFMDTLIASINTVNFKEQNSQLHQEIQNLKSSFNLINFSFRLITENNLDKFIGDLDAFSDHLIQVSNLLSCN